MHGHPPSCRLYALRSGRLKGAANNMCKVTRIRVALFVIYYANGCRYNTIKTQISKKKLKYYACINREKTQHINRTLSYYIRGGA